MEEFSCHSLWRILQVIEVFFSHSVSRGSEETDHVSVSRTSEALAVITAPRPTNMGRTATEVSLSCDIIQVGVMSWRSPVLTLTCLSSACPCIHGQCDNRPDSDGRCKPDSCQTGFTGRFCDRATAACGVLAQFCHAHAACSFNQGTTR